MRHKERITSSMTMIEGLQAVSEGNPGALNVLMQLMTKTPEVDPMAALGPLINILHLDSMGIYGPRIWMLYKDVCRENIYLVMALLRANQLGKINQGMIDHAIDNRGEGLEYDSLKSIMQRVRDEIGEFNVPEEFEV